MSDFAFQFKDASFSGTVMGLLSLTVSGAVSGSRARQATVTEN
jgi:hypothetical protein